MLIQFLLVSPREKSRSSCGLDRRCSFLRDLLETIADSPQKYLILILDSPVAGGRTTQSC
jgi:hypothetical protein